MARLLLVLVLPLHSGLRNRAFRRERARVGLSRPRLCRRPASRLFTRLTLTGVDGHRTVVRVPYAGTTTCP